MAVDQQALAGGFVDGEPGEMDFPDQLVRNRVEIGFRVDADILGADMDVVDVDKQAAPGPFRRLDDERHLVHFPVRQNEVIGRILDQDRPPQRLLHLVDIVAQAVEARPAEARRQQVGEPQPVMRGPGDVFGNEPWIETLDQPAERLQMVRVEPFGPAEGHADAVQGQRITAAQVLENRGSRPAGDHVVFRMDLEPADIRPVPADGLGVLALEPDAGPRRYPGPKDGKAR